MMLVQNNSQLHLLFMQFTETRETLRTIQGHDHHCELVKSNGPLVEFYKTTYGVNRESKLNSLMYVHVCDELLPPDIMHDILEGYLPHVLKQLVPALRNYGISLELINNIVNSFEFGEDCKPSPLQSTSFNSDGTSIGQSGK